MAAHDGWHFRHSKSFIYKTYISKNRLVMYHFPWITFSKAQLKTLISDHRILHISRKLRPVMYFFWFSPCWPILPFLSKKNFLVWGGKNVLCSRCERELPFPVIPGNTSLKFPFPWHFVISLPVPGKRKFWPGIRTGNTIIICSFADGWSRHEN